MLVRRWTPPSQVPTSSADNIPTTQRTCARWCKVFISALIASALISFVVVYPLQKNDLFNRDYSRQKQQEHEREQRLTFDNYIEDISKTLLQSTDQPEKYRHIQSRTLLALRTLDTQRKHEVILFLYQRDLLGKNQVDLHGADLNHVQLTCPQDFHHLHLMGVHWSHAILSNCRLNSANFDQADLHHARFINCTLDHASFVHANLEQSEFISTSVRNVSFTSASLIQANFLGADVVQGNHFINADLYQANFTADQFEGKKFSTIPHDFQHARYPNGSFGSIDSNKNLLIDTECKTDSLTGWKTIYGNLSWTLENTTTATNETSEEICLLVMSGKIRVYQTIYLPLYSLLINTNNAIIKFDGLASCNQSYFEIHTYRSDDIELSSQIYSEPTKENNRYGKMYQYGEHDHRLPTHTDHLELYFGINHPEPNIKCSIADLILTIHQP